MEKTIVKYLTNSATQSEIEALESWVKIEGNKKIFEEYIKINFTSNQLVVPPNVLKNKKELLEKANRKKPVFVLYKFKKLYKYAAIFIGLISISLFFIESNYLQSKSENNSASQNIIIPDNHIVLKNEKGDIQVLTKGEKTATISNSEGKQIAKHTGSQVKYDLDSNTIQELVYNEMIVPYGKRINLTLSDGSIVHLNSGTSFKFPVKFISGKERKVFLKGEGYFEVAKNKKDPFIINSNAVDIKVLGTSFNVSSYQEDQNINTVLVEGSVEIYRSDTTDALIKLTPGHLASWNKQVENIKTTKVNTSIYTSWVIGKLILKDTPFKIIRKKLERYYNVTIINKNTELDKQRYNVNFDNETIEQILKTINENFDINYTITDNKIIIN